MNKNVDTNLFLSAYICNMRYIYSLCLLIGCFGTVLSQRDGAFTPQAGGGIVQLNIDYVKYDRLFIENPDSARGGYLLRDISDFTATLSAEYALGDKFVVFANFPVKYVASATAVNPFSDFSDTLSSGTKLALGNIDIGVKYKFYEKKFTFSASLRGELMTSNYDEKTGLSTGIQGWGIVPILHIGRFWSQKYFINLNAGGCYRTSGYSSDIRLNLSGGVKIKQVIWVKAIVDFRRSLRNGYYESVSGNQTGLYINNQEWLGFQGMLGYEAKMGLGIEVGLRGNVLAANIPRSIFFTGGIYYKWKNQHPTYN